MSELKDFHIPQNLLALYRKKNKKLEKKIPELLKPLNERNYRKKFHILLFFMQIEDNFHLPRSNAATVTLTKPYTQLLGINTSDMTNHGSNLMSGDLVHIKDGSIGSIVYKGRVVETENKKILIDMGTYYHKKYSGEEVCVKFYKCPRYYRVLHNAVDMGFEKFGQKILFPKELIPANDDDVPTSPLVWFNSPNEKQKTAISNFIHNKYNLPYIIDGPPGTGKTFTLIEAILQTYNVFPNSRIIVVAPSNHTAKNIMKLLIKSENIDSQKLIRLISVSAAEKELLSMDLKKYCAFIYSRKTKLLSEYDNVFKGISCLNLTEISKSFKIIVSTIGNIAKLVERDPQNGFCSHLFIDEASQITEPEMLMALTLVDKNYGRVCLVGDPKQLGPVIRSEKAKHYGIGTSFLERILSTKLYKNNSCVVTQLVENYRSLPKVLETPNKLFYNNSLTTNLDIENEKIKSDLNILLNVMNNKEKLYDLPNIPGLFFHCVKGFNQKPYNGTSWLNAQESVMVIMYIWHLYDKGFTSADIGIITPYIAQVELLEKFFKSRTIDLPQIGTVEKFQGSEKKVIILSTVRAGEITNEKSVKFISCPKRVNVALTRAKLMTIIIGDIETLYLSKNKLWHKIIEDIRKNNAYITHPELCIP